MKRCFIRFVILPLIVACSLIWFNCVGDQAITEPNQNQIAELKAAITKTNPVQVTETAEFLSEVSKKVGRTLTKEEDHFLNQLLALVKKINSENPARRKATGKKYLDMMLIVSPNSEKSSNKIIFNSVEEALEFIKNSFPLVEVVEKSVSPPIRNDQWIGDDDIYTGFLTDYKQLFTDQGYPAAYGRMNSQFWYANHKQIQFSEDFNSWSNLGFTCSIEEKEHSANGSRVVFGKGVLHCGFGIQIGNLDLTLSGESTTTLSKSYVIPNY